jgi:phosphatidylserine/phosphatidylglycerophosphate/cardiolipin synthase-like enzyme
MKALLSDDLWQELSKHAAGHRRLRAAISYVKAAHLDFRRGDLLVCDASDHAIKGGLTSAALLRTFFDQGAEVYSYEGLHSKVVIIDDKALIGSANLSENASITTCEAALLTDDPQVTALILGFVEKVKNEAERITEDFLDRIQAFPVVTRF